MIIKITFFISLFILNPIYSQTLFNWDVNPIDNGNNVTEMVDGITTTFTGTSETGFENVAGFGGSTGNIVNSSIFGTLSTSVTFSFSESVDINSILALEGNSANVDFTFTPTGGSNSGVVASLTNGTATVNLNWSNVTSFTVTTSTEHHFAFDNLVVNGPILSTHNIASEKVIIYPNPVLDILYIKNSKKLKTANLYDNIGQLIIKTTEGTIDFTNLAKGIYFLQLHTGVGIETKKILKK